MSRAELRDLTAASSHPTFSAHLKEEDFSFRFCALVVNGERKKHQKKKKKKVEELGMWVD